MGYGGMPMKVISYKERYVAFIDILGFKNLIDRSITVPPEVTLDSIVEALKFKSPVGRDKIVLGRIGDISNSDHKMSTFSDNVFISTNTTENGLIHILHHVEQISFKLLKLGFLCRGGITKGLCYHHDNIVFGPAVIEAYKIEKEEAKYPRTLLSEKVLYDGKNTISPVKEVFFNLIREDHDSKYFIHYLRIIRLFSDSMEREQPRDYLNMLETIKAKIEKELLNVKKIESKDCPNKNLKVSEVEKIEWIKDYFESATDRSHLDLLNTEYPLEI